MFRLYTVCITAVVLSGCAALDLKRSVATEDLATTKNIGVVSWLGDTFNGTSIGTTVFNNEYFTAQVPDWRISNFATSRAVIALNANNRQAAALDLSGLDPRKLGVEKDSQIWDAAIKQRFDKLVVIGAGVSDNVRMFKPGFGLQQTGLFFTTPNRCVYVGYVISVFDVSTRKSVGWEWGGGQYPCEAKSANDIPFKSKFSDYSPNEQQLLRWRVEKRLADTVPYTLGELALIPETPIGKSK